jgi:hypothetical protein
LADDGKTPGATSSPSPLWHFKLKGADTGMDGFVFFDSLVLIEVVEWDGVEPQAFSNNLTQMPPCRFP